MCMTEYCKKFFAAAMTGVMLLSSASCGMIEMRDSTADLEEKEESAPLMLEPAERVNTVETRQEAEIITAEEPAAAVTLCLTGDIRIDDNIIRDAANRAAEGKSYSFVRMYSGVFRNICSADLAFGAYSTVSVPAGSDGSRNTPVESLAALADVGFDVLDTEGAENDPVDLAEYGIFDVDSENDISFIEKNGLVLAFMSSDGTDLNGVKTAAEMADAVIVSVDWTDGSAHEDNEKTAYELALAGADVIIGKGNTLGGIQWIDAGDGAPALCAYSLGNLIATSNDPFELCGGLLELTLEEEEDGCRITGVLLSPSIVRYTEGYADYQLVMLEDYGCDLSEGHSVSGADCETILPYVRETVTTEFLDPDLRG